MFNQQSKLLLSQLVMQLTTFVGIYYYWGTFTGLDYFIIFISIFFFAVVTLETFLHRYCSHKAFELDKKIETFLLYCSTLILQPPALVWSPNHIKHHRYSDEKEDPHSPKYMGYWKVFFGYFFAKEEDKRSMIYAKDLLRDKEHIFIHKHLYTCYCIWFLVVFSLYIYD